MKRLSMLILALMLALAACQGKPAEVTGQTVSVHSGIFSDVNADELNAMLEDKDFVFVNVHIPFEGNIANTDLSIPYDQIGQSLSQLPTDKNAKIVLYCRSGRMSAIAAETLVDLGYANVWNLKGGMLEWELAGLPIEAK